MHKIRNYKYRAHTQTHTFFKRPSILFLYNSEKKNYTHFISYRIVLPKPYHTIQCNIFLLPICYNHLCTITAITIKKKIRHFQKYRHIFAAISVFYTDIITTNWRLLFLLFLFFFVRTKSSFVWCAPLSLLLHHFLYDQHSFGCLYIYIGQRLLSIVCFVYIRCKNECALVTAFIYG